MPVARDMLGCKWSVLQFHHQSSDERPAMYVSLLVKRNSDNLPSAVSLPRLQDLHHLMLADTKNDGKFFWLLPAPNDALGTVYILLYIM